jgi:hypothetical protein
MCDLALSWLLCFHTRVLLTVYQFHAQGYQNFHFNYRTHHHTHYRAHAHRLQTALEVLRARPTHQRSAF